MRTSQELIDKATPTVASISSDTEKAKIIALLAIATALREVTRAIENSR